MAAQKKKRWRLYLFTAVVLAGVLYLFFNNFGILKYVKLKSEVDDLRQQIEILEAENNKLKSEVDSLLRQEPAKIERTAREKYDMLRPGEQKIEVIEK